MTPIIYSRNIAEGERLVPSELKTTQHEGEPLGDMRARARDGFVAGGLGVAHGRGDLFVFVFFFSTKAGREAYGEPAAVLLELEAGRDEADGRAD